MTNTMVSVLAAMNLELRPVYADVCTNLCADCRQGLYTQQCHCTFEKVFTGRYEIVDKKAEQTFIEKARKDQRNQRPNPV